MMSPLANGPWLMFKEISEETHSTPAGTSRPPRLGAKCLMFDCCSAENVVEEPGSYWEKPE